MVFLYLRRSFRYRPMRHFSLFWVLLCAFLLPLVVSVYRDSMMYGSYLQTIAFSKGQAIHIFGGQSEDVELLRGIDGLTEPYYEDGWIYLSFASEDAWEFYSDSSSRSNLTKQIRALLLQNGREEESITVTFYTYQDVYGTKEDAILLAKWRKLLLFCLALCLFSGLIVQSTYRSHIAAFSTEIEDFAAIGAENRQIFGIFLLEFAVLFPLAVGGAVGIAYVVMRILCKLYLEQTVGSTIVWRVFRMDSKNTAILVAFYLLVCFGAFIFALLRKPRSRRIKKSRRAPTSLTRLWVRQIKPPVAQCLVILVPLIAAFVVLFNRYLGTYSSSLRDAQSVEISVSSALSGFSQEELDFISGLSGIQQMESVRSGTKVFCYLDAPDGNTLHGYLYRYQDYAPDEPDLEDDQFVSNIPYWFEATGTFTLRDENYRIKGYVTEVKRITPEGEMPGFLTIYVSNATMNMMEANQPIVKLKISTTAAYASYLEDALRSELPANYTIRNSRNEDLASAALQEGHLWMLGWIFCILMLTAIQIIWVRLSSYVREQEAMLKIVHNIGASHRQLSRLFPIWSAAILAAVLPYLIAVPYIYLRAWYVWRTWNNNCFILSLPLLGIYAALAVLASLIFLLPIKYTLHRIYRNSE